MVCRHRSCFQRVAIKSSKVVFIDKPCINFQVTQIQNASQHFIDTEREKRSRVTRARSLGGADNERLVVTIIEGADLQASDPNGASDPYCEASMGSQEHRTKVITNNLNPKWNSTVWDFPSNFQFTPLFKIFDKNCYPF